MTRFSLAILAAACLCAATMGVTSAIAAPPNSVSKSVGTEGKVSTVKIEVGPFDLHRKYRSMEGPYITQPFRVSDLVTSEKVEIPESMVTFVEGSSGPGPTMGGPSMSSQVPTASSDKNPIGLLDTSRLKRELYWFKGMKLQVLDEHDKPLPTAEFICHLNLDVDQRFRYQAFPEAEHTGNSRLMTLTQGQTGFYFPDGFAVPVASDEVWTFTFQAANRTTTAHRRVKHLCTMEFIKDSERTKKITALHWYNPYIAVVVDKATSDAEQQKGPHGPDCLFNSPGDAAPNMVSGSTFKDAEGRRLSGHWSIPVGTHTYRTPIVEARDPGFSSQDRRIHAVWSHVHPLCLESSLVMCDGNDRKKLFTAKTKTRTKGGLEILSIEDILSPEGILVAAGKHYEVEATYANDTGETQDSMVALGVFFEDNRFKKPDWPALEAAGRALEKPPQLVLNTGKDGVFCGIKSDDAVQATPVKANGTEQFRLFDARADGPLLTGPKTMEIETTEGKIHIVLDPTLAPYHATQLYKLLKSGAFNGTPIYRYEPNFVLQTANAETKADGKPPMAEQSYELLRRLPLEVQAQDNGNGLHKKWVLSMARYDQPTDSAVSSFSILLGEAPHLDHQYTVFGRAVPDDATVQTIETIKKNWAQTHPVILSVHEVSNSVASAESKN